MRAGQPREIVTKDSQVKDFSVVKRRWAVERSLGWLRRHCGLARVYETLPGSSEPLITFAMIDNLACRLTDEHTSIWRPPIAEHAKCVNQTFPRC
ncbi:transposase, IS4 family protein [Actinoplanes sp. SE50]|uniref:transposase n=1 Tax=unclassified Actinoplanes TaxID=2626549 RepID=UPI00023ED226|nr:MULTISPECIES: transposase [unclassified Actinoplanes]AEV84396.1 transposase, IS4 family protein [Actinoplanes sp. SE50/110]ATO82788.1 transposase, IS4 family protein [Actinoplanes sp. SE50]SLM00196.1 hypothetical protein ACSP50_3428 [Actinoplanes sp. SE50/110]